jgi:septum formation protein
MADRDDRPGLILASGSRTRREMLQAAGLAFTVVPADIDEAALRAHLLSSKPGITPAGIAEELARAKAETVSRDHPHALVIGCDQVLAFDGTIFEKPRDMSDARDCLMKLRGAEHELHSAAALAVNGVVSWSHTDTARLTMRAFSPAAVDEYLARDGVDVCRSVGAYQIEGHAIQLFDKVDGDYFTILGVPLLPLLAELRARKVLVA